MENQKLKRLLEDYDREGNSEARLGIVSEVKSLLTLPPDIFGSSVPYTFHDLTVMKCIVKTLKGYPADKLTSDVKCELCHQLSAVCVLFLKPTPQLLGNFLIDVLVVLRSMQIIGRVPEKVDELYRVVSKCVDDGTYSGDVETHLWLCSRRTFEQAVLQCFVSETRPTPHTNNNKILNSLWQRIVLESRANRDLFRTAASVVAIVCRMACGNTTIINLAKTFFGAVHKKRQLQETISLFPSRLHSLLITILLPWREIPSEMILVHLDHLCGLALDGLESGLWSVGDIAMLALACPDWYQVLLEAVAFDKDDDSRGYVLLSRMWNFECPDNRRHLTMALKVLDLS